MNAIAGFSSCGPDHHPNGLLFRGTQTSPNNRHKLYFSQPRGAANAPSTVLKGYGFMGALSIGQRLDPEKYFRILGWKGVNLTRVWAVERWNGRVDEDSICQTDQTEGPTPFVGTWVPVPPNGSGGDYHLDQANPDFYKHLRKFAQEAADRGIVVQLSLYDIHGLLNYTLRSSQTVCRGRFSDSPYNSLHNSNGYIGTAPSDCGLCPVDGGLWEVVEGRDGTCRGPNGFVQNANLQANHLDYVRRVAEEVGGMGNVMFEIINEAMAGLDWWDTNPRGDAWQLLQAEILRKGLPIRIVRDAFNDDWTSGSSRTFALANRVSDQKVSGADVWTASNVRVVQSRDSVSDGGVTISTDSWLGYATSNGEGTLNSMSATLPFPEPTSWTSLNVRGQLTATAGDLSLSVGKPYGESVIVTFHRGTGMLQLWEIGNCLAFCDHGSVSVSNPERSHEVRLKLTRQSANQYLATVFLDGEETTLSNVPIALTAQTGAITWAGFSGSASGGVAYPPGTGKVDSFEATYTCLSCAASFGDPPGPVESDQGEGI